MELWVEIFQIFQYVKGSSTLFKFSLHPSIVNRASSACWRAALALSQKTHAVFSYQGGRNKLSVTQVFASYLNILHLPFQVLFKHIEINVLSWVSHKNKFPIDKTQNCFKCLQIQVGSHLFAC